MASDSTVIAYNWVIEDFSKLEEDVNIRSPVFGSGKGDHYGEVFFYLDMATLHWSDGLTKFMVRLLLDSGDGGVEPKIKIEYKIMLVDINGNSFKVKGFDCNNFGKPKGIFGSGLNYDISKSYLFTNAYWLLPEDRLTVRCEIYYLQHEIEKAKFDQSRLSHLHTSYLSSLLEDGTQSDVTLLVFDQTKPTDDNDNHKTSRTEEKTKQFRAHKLILSTRSPTFAAMFQKMDSTEAQESEVKITDVSIEVFEVFLRYLYTGQVDLVYEYGYFGDKLAVDLLPVAHKYQVDSLKQTCEHYLLSIMDIYSVCNYLHLAHMHSALDLKFGCIKFIATRDNSIKVMVTEEWNALISTNLDLMNELLQSLVDRHY